MCYSPEADLMAGLVIGVLGVDALRHVDRRRDLPIAALPVVLAVHQTIEAAAWWGLEGDVPPILGSLAITAYLLIALVVLPVMVPYAVMRTEPDRRVRTTMAVFVGLGLLVSSVVLFGLMTNPYDAAIGGRFINYETTVPGGGLITALYAVAVCTPFLLSSHRRLVVFGMINIPVVIILALFLSTGLISLWCVWAAVGSVVIVRHLREPAASRFETPSGVTTA
jgi:hypothetical protein